MESHIEALTKYCTLFVSSLVDNGLKHVVISPGSRSTPLAMTMCEHPDINEWVIVDERSAAFFALGQAKRLQQPVALLCTSGTAVTNYFSAIVEAYQSRVPLLVLTADRPHELRDVGAPQAIDQIEIFGNYVKWFHEMALPEANPKILNYVQSQAGRALFEAQTGNPGPVHLNFPFREPLIPDFSFEGSWDNQPKDEKYKRMLHSGQKALTTNQLKEITQLLATKRRGVIVCGPQQEKGLPRMLTALAEKWKLPILADPLSQLRAGDHSKACVIESYDSILRSERVRAELKPDFIIRFGAMPVSKMYLHYIQENRDSLQFVVETEEGYRDPLHHETHFIFSDPMLLCEGLIRHANVSMDSAWLKKWQQMNSIVKDYLNTENHLQLTEGQAVRSTLNNLPNDSMLFVGNSMAIRDVDTFFQSMDKNISIYANRGASGIDGVTSSALGVAAHANNPTTLIIGDLSFYHDLNGLLTAKQYKLDITILLINNNGGGIFSFLPQAANGKNFERLFGTPLNIDFKHAVHMYGGTYELIKDEAHLQVALKKSYEQTGVSVIEVQTDRTENTKWHQEKWHAINEALLKLKE